MNRYIMPRSLPFGRAYEIIIRIDFDRGVKLPGQLLETGFTGIGRTLIYLSIKFPHLWGLTRAYGVVKLKWCDTYRRSRRYDARAVCAATMPALSALLRCSRRLCCYDART